MWYGRWIGGTLGFMTGGPWGAALGLAYGERWDQAWQQMMPGLGISYSGSRNEDVLLDTLFGCLGALAQSDHWISPNEQRLLKAITAHMKLSPSRESLALESYRQGLEERFPLKEKLQRFRINNAFSPRSRAILISFVIQAAYADGEPCRDKEAFLQEFRVGLGISVREFWSLRQQIHQEWVRHSQSNGSSYRTIDECYRTLGLARSASLDDVKKAYRRLMNKYHPDKLAGQSPGDLARATRKTQTIQDAYARIKNYRLSV